MKKQMKEQMKEKMKEQKTILLVDDEEGITDLLSDEFIELGHRVFMASNGVDAFSLFQLNKIDCVVTDIHMPGGDGIPLISNIRREKSGIPIFLLSGSSSDKVEDFSNLSLSAIIKKPFDFDELISLVLESLKES